GRPQRNPVLLCGARKIVFRQVRPVGRRRIVGADHRDRAVVRLAPQHVCGRKPRRPSADDDDRWRRHRWSPVGADRKVGPYLRTNSYDVALALDTPASDRVECWRAYSLASLQTETGVMPRASNRPVDNDPVGKRAVIVRAVGADRKDLVARPRKK